MKKFNINNYVHIQITDYGWEHLYDTLTEGYIQHSIAPYKVVIDDVTWYKLQMHQVFELLPPLMGDRLMFENTILIDDKEFS